MADDMAVNYYRHRQNHSSKLRGYKSKYRRKYDQNDNSKRKDQNVIKTLYYDSHFQTRDDSPSNGYDNINFIATNKKTNREKKKQRLKKLGRGPIPMTTDEYFKMMTKQCSVPEINSNSEHGKQKTKRRRSDTVLNTSTPYRTKFIINTVILDPKIIIPPECQHVLNHPLMQAQIRIYRCQLSSPREACCCSCNSDAMFEVMKSLYDCYKKKNCDHCNCILCGHLPKLERKLGEARKSRVTVGVETASTRQKPKETMIAQAKETGLLTPLAGKTPEQKEKIMRELAKMGLPLPEVQTKSEKKLVDKVRRELGLPPAPKSMADKARYEEAEKLGIMQPLEGKTEAEKEKILTQWHDRGIELPEGRSPSEKALIAKVKASPKKAPTLTISQKLRKIIPSGRITTLEGKTPEEKEKNIRSRALSGLPIPEGKTASERKIIEKVRTELGLPPEPKTAADREKYEKAQSAGLIVPLEGKSQAQKDKIIRGLAERGISLPEGRTTSEKALIKSIQAEVKPIMSEKLRKAKAAGLMTPLEGKTQEQKEKILRGLAENGIPLPEGKTTSERKLIDKVRKDLGLPPEPKTSTEKARYIRAHNAGLITPFEGKTAAQKEKILTGLAEKGIPLPEGRTSSEKALIKKIQAEFKPIPPMRVPSEKIRRAKDAGLITPLEGKTAEQKEKIIRGLAEHGIPLPEGNTASERKIIDKVRKDLGLPPEPKSSGERQKYNQAQAAGLITPLEGKTAAQKEKILTGLAEQGIPLPEGRTASEKALVKQIQAKIKPLPSVARITSEKLRKAKTADILTPLTGKTPQQREKIIRGLVQSGLPLPEGKTASEQNIIDKVRRELGLPPEPKTSTERHRYNQAQATGLITPLEGKSAAQKEKILKALAAQGITLPEGRTASEKALIKKIQVEVKPLPPMRVPSEKIRRAKDAGLITPLEGKTAEQKEKIIRGLAEHGIPLPEGKTASERKIIDKVRKDFGLPPEPKSSDERQKYNQAQAAGLITPLEGKTAAQKEKILTRLAEQGIPLPEGRTSSEKALIKKIQAEVKPSAARITSEKMRKSKAAGLLTILDGKSPEQKEKILRGLANSGLPLPDPKTASEHKLINKIRKEFRLPPAALPPAERRKLDEVTGKHVKEGKGPVDECFCGLLTPESERVSVGKAKPSAAGVLSERMRKAKTAGILTPLEGKTPEQKENIIRGLVQSGLPIPQGKTASERKLIDKIRKEIGLPPEPQTSAERVRYNQAQAAGLITPLEGKTAAQKEKILTGLAEQGVPLPEGRTPSEKALIKKIQAEIKPLPPSVRIPAAKLRKAKETGLITPLEGKSAEQKEKIIRGLADHGIPLPEGKTASERQIIDKVRKDLGLPPEPKSSGERIRYNEAQAKGLITPLEGKTAAQKEKILTELAEHGIPLPEGRSSSEKALIKKIKTEVKPLPPSMRVPSEKMRKAAAAGLMTPLKGKSPEQKEKIIRGLAEHGILLPEGKTASERQIIDKVRKYLGLPPEPKSSGERIRYNEAQAKGLITPLEGKTAAQKEKILTELAEHGIPLPEGRTSSEKALIKKIKTEVKLLPPSMRVPSEKMRKATAAGLMTPLKGKSPEQKEKIIRGLAKQRIPLPEGKTVSERKIIDKVRKELGLPPQPKSSAERFKYNQAQAAGLITPLEGKTASQKEKILRGLAEEGLPLPEGRTPSEKALIKSIQAEVKQMPSARRAQSDRMPKAREAGLITPLEGKTAEQKEKILRGLAEHRIPLPLGKTASERKIIDKVRKDLGLPPEPKSSAERVKYAQAQGAGLITPLEGKTAAQKEKILTGLTEQGIPLPEGRTASEKALIKKIQAEVKPLPPMRVPSEKIRKAKDAGLITPLEGKTAEQKEKIIRGLAEHGIPLPEGKTASERKIIDKVRKDLGLPPEPKSSDERQKYNQAQAAGLITPLEGKTAAQKEKILTRLAEQGIPLPEGRTSSEKALIKKIQAEVKPSAARITSEKMLKSKAAGLLTTLDGKSPEQKEKILRGLANSGLPLPDPKTASEHKLINKIRKEFRLPPAALPPAERRKLDEVTGKHVKEGKGPVDECICGLLTPESERVSVGKAKPSAAGVLSERMRKAKTAGILTPLEGKTPEQKENIIRGLVQSGLPIPQGKTASERKLIDKIRKEIGLPPEPQTSAERVRYNQAQAAGLITPLEGKTAAQKEKILTGLAEQGVPLPEGRTPSEKALIKKIQAEIKPLPPSVRIPAAKLRKAKETGLITPLESKPTEQKEKIIRGLAEHGIPLPEGKTASERKIIDKVRKELGLPPEPKSSAERMRYNQAQTAGLITPLEGKSAAQKDNILRGLAEQGIPLPEGRTPSEKALIKSFQAEAKGKPSAARVFSEKIRKAKAAGLMTPLEGKTAEQKEKNIRGFAEHGVPLPEGKSASERKLIDKVRKDLGLPPEPKTSIERQKYNQAQAAGLITPLEGKSGTQKEKILTGLAEQGIPLPEGRTSSEKALIKKIQAKIKPLASVMRNKSDKMQKARAAGLLTPLENKTSEQKEKILRGLAEHGIPLPDAKTVSEHKLINKVRKDFGLPAAALLPAERRKLDDATAKNVKEGKGPVDECICSLLTPESDRVSVTKPDVFPLKGKTKEEKENIIRNLAKQGLPLPEAKTASEKQLIEKLQAELGLPPEPTTKSLKEKYELAKAQGLITPLVGKTASQREKILRGRAAAGLPLREGRTASEKSLIKKIKHETGYVSPIERASMARAKAAGLLTPLEGKTAEQKEKILKSRLKAGLPLPEGKTPSEKEMIKKIKSAAKAGLLTPLEGKPSAEKEKILKGMVKSGIPLPEGKTSSDKKLIEKVRTEMGLPPEPKTPSIKLKMSKAQAAGIITPLEGKTSAQKEKILKSMAAAGIPLPEGRTASEKVLIKKVATEALTKKPSAKLRAAKAAGLLTPLEGKTSEQKEKILKELAKSGIPLPEGKTPSEKGLIKKIRTEIGLPPEPKTPSMKEKMSKAQAAGLITPLEGKTSAQKEVILKSMAAAGISLPEGRTASEKALIKKIESEPPTKVPSAKLGAAKAGGFLTPLEGKTLEEKERILRGLAKSGVTLPEGKTPSEKKLIQKVRTEMGLPQEPKTLSMKEKMSRAQALGIITPLEGKTSAQKEKTLRSMAAAGITLPEGRTASEKALVKKVETEMAEKISKAKKEGLLTPLEGKKKEEKERILQGLAAAGLALPDGKTASEKSMVRKIRAEHETPSMKKRFKTTKSGTKPSKKVAKGMVTRSFAGVQEEIEEIHKTTTCERGCGCDKKKIRFKHSYVKIRVTSPDISSFCPCPDECIPGVKGGVFTDSEGIKVTVGRATGVPSCSIPPSPKCEDKISQQPTESDSLIYSQSHISLDIATISTDCTTDGSGSKSTVYIYNSESDVSIIHLKHILHRNTCKRDLEKNIEDYAHDENQLSHIFQSHYKNKDNFYQPIPSQITLKYSNEMDSVSESSSGSFYLIETESSNSDYSRDTIRVLSSLARNLDAGTDYPCAYTSEDDYLNYAGYESSRYSVKERDLLPIYTFLRNNRKYRAMINDAYIYRLSESRLDMSRRTRACRDPLRDARYPTSSSCLNNIELDNLDAMRNAMSSKSLSASSIFILVSTSGKESSFDSCGSTVCLEMSETIQLKKRLKTLFKTEPITRVEPRVSKPGGLRISKKGHKFMFEGTPKKDIGGHGRELFKPSKNVDNAVTCQTSIELKVQRSNRAVSMDTTEDRPCCCEPAEQYDSDDQHYDLEDRSVAVADVISSVFNPVVVREGLSEEAYMNIGYNQTPSFHTNARNRDTVARHIPEPYIATERSDIDQRLTAQPRGCQAAENMSPVDWNTSVVNRNTQEFRPQHRNALKMGTNRDVPPVSWKDRAEQRVSPERSDLGKKHAAHPIGCDKPPCKGSGCHPRESTSAVNRNKPAEYRPKYRIASETRPNHNVPPASWMDKADQRMSPDPHTTGCDKPPCKGSGCHPSESMSPTGHSRPAEYRPKHHIAPEMGVNRNIPPVSWMDRANQRVPPDSLEFGPIPSARPTTCNTAPCCVSGSYPKESMGAINRNRQAEYRPKHRIAPEMGANRNIPPASRMDRAEQRVSPDSIEFDPRSSARPTTHDGAPCCAGSYPKASMGATDRNGTAEYRPKHRMSPDRTDNCLRPQSTGCNLPPCKGTQCHPGESMNGVDRNGAAEYRPKHRTSPEMGVNRDLPPVSWRGSAEQRVPPDRADMGQRPAGCIVPPCRAPTCHTGDLYGMGRIRFSGIEFGPETTKLTMGPPNKEMKSVGIEASSPTTEAAQQLIQGLQRTPSGTVFCPDQKILDKIISLGPCPQVEKANGEVLKTGKACVCHDESTSKRRWGKKKKHTCECPASEQVQEPQPELEPEPELVKVELMPPIVPMPRLASVAGIIPYEWIQPVDEAALLRETRKLRSDQTQTTSGFKMDKKKRPPPPPPPPPPFEVDENMSFEDALAYFEQHPEDIPLTEPPEPLRTAVLPPQSAPSSAVQPTLPPTPPPSLAQPRSTYYDECFCNEPKKSKKGNICDCPPELAPAQTEANDTAGTTPEDNAGANAKASDEEANGEPTEPEEPFRGLKFHMGGKGSATPGLAGICCFDLLEGSAASSLNKSDSEVYSD